MSPAPNLQPANPTRRFRILGSFLANGLLVSLLTMALFAVIAYGVVGIAAVSRFDLDIATTLHNGATATGIRIFTAITALGNQPSLTALAIGITVVLLLLRRRLLALGTALTAVGGGLLNAALKAGFHRTRPVFANPYVVEQSWSFPSGHAMSSLIGYGVLLYVIVVLFRPHWLRTVAVSLLICLIELIGFSRLYLGAHYVSDVMAGYAAGITWLTISITGMERTRRRGLKRVGDDGSPADLSAGYRGTKP